MVKSVLLFFSTRRNIGLVLRRYTGAFSNARYVNDTGIDSLSRPNLAISQLSSLQC